MLNKKHTLKPGKNIRKRDFKEKTRQQTKKEKILMKKNFVIEYVDVVLFMKQKQRRKKRKERDKNKEVKESKKKDRKEERKEEERDRERAIEKGGGHKKAKEKQRETLKNKQKIPFSRGKTVFDRSKERKGKKIKQENTNKIRRV